MRPDDWIWHKQDTLSGSAKNRQGSLMTPHAHSDLVTNTTQKVQPKHVP